MRRPRSYPAPIGEPEKSIRLPGYDDAPDTESAGLWTLFIVLACVLDIMWLFWRRSPLDWLQWVEVVAAAGIVVAVFAAAFRSANEERTVTFPGPAPDRATGDVGDTRMQP